MCQWIRRTSKGQRLETRWCQSRQEELVHIEHILEILSQHRNIGRMEMVIQLGHIVQFSHHTRQGQLGVQRSIRSMQLGLGRIVGIEQMVRSSSNIELMEMAGILEHIVRLVRHRSKGQQLVVRIG
jgi:hypothetical protein